MAAAHLQRLPRDLSPEPRRAAARQRQPRRRRAVIDSAPTHADRRREAFNGGATIHSAPRTDAHKLAFGGRVVATSASAEPAGALRLLLEDLDPLDPGAGRTLPAKPNHRLDRVGIPCE